MVRYMSSGQSRIDSRTNADVLLPPPPPSLTPVFLA
jgi:hypothetical protein